MSNILVYWLANARIAYERRRAIDSLSRLGDAQLLDIGLERGTIEDHVRDGMPWQAYEAEPKASFQPSAQGCG